ncbi:unnamed protein product, partial [Meganyctiphanes norvegica]
MGAEKVICCVIMLCQMCAILSGVALLYGSVIVIIPSKDELAMNFHETPIMCTTVKAGDILAGGKKLECDWTTCGEWCLSKGGGSCFQINVMARNNGSNIKFRDCVDVSDQQCSALNVNLTRSYACKKGQCKELTGLFNCTKDDDNECREITPAFRCNAKLDRKTVMCNTDDDKCEERLSGVYTCMKGECQVLPKIKKYWKDCERKCTKLKMQERNVVMFSKERLVTTSCQSMESMDNNTISEVALDQEWIDKKSVMFIFCTFVKVVKGKTLYDLLTKDCFNATLVEAPVVDPVTNYLDLLQIHQDLAEEADNYTDRWIIGPERNLRIMNNTQLRINPEGCVNSLRDECKAFIFTHGHDGADGITPDRFECFYTDQNEDYVIGKFNPKQTRMLLLFASVVPGTLFGVACFCLFIFSKAVGVNDEGKLHVTLMKGNQGAVKEPVQFDELLI